MKARVVMMLASVLLIAATSCGGKPGTARASPTPAPTPTPTPTSTSTPTYATVADRCLVGAEGRQLTLDATDGSTIHGAVFGDGQTVAVFVHQVGASGMCGWVPYAAWAARHGIRALVIDLCYYGESHCTTKFGHSIAGQIGLPMAWARAHGASAVTLVGASMGGTLVTGVGQRLGADAIVNISSPPQWYGVPSVPESARSITVPFLLVAANDDAAIQPAVLRQALESSPSPAKQFVSVATGHGYTIVTNGSITAVEITPVGRKMLTWIRGKRDAFSTR